MAESRKQAVSIRLSTGDVRRIKRLAQRLAARDSDIIRFAVKSMFAKLGPLLDQETRGRSLVPAFLEIGPEVVRFFELDAVRLDAIINEGADHGNVVARDDLILIALMGTQSSYATMRVSDLLSGNGNIGSDSQVSATLRQYLYEKYVFRNLANQEAAEPRAMRVANGISQN